jgi:hypothetical protein
MCWRLGWLLVPLASVTGCARQPQSVLLEGVHIIDRSCRVWPADTISLDDAHERYGVTCSPQVNPSDLPLYQSARPVGAYARVGFLLCNAGARQASAKLEGVDGKAALVGRRLVREDCAEFTFDSVPPASYGLYGSVGRLRERVSVIEVRAGELWELWWVAPGAR